PMLNPRGVDFEQVVFQGKRKGKFEGALIDEIGLTAMVEGGPVTGGPVVELKVAVDCAAKGRAISPFIYGIAYDHQRADDDVAVDLNATIRRWGGNHTSRYNWQLGNAWNTANDYYYMNVNYTGKADYSYETFFAQQQKWDLKTALTVPMIGWVAKDTTTLTFPKSIYPKQERFAPDNEMAGNGVAPDGKPIPSPPPTHTSIAAPPEFIGKWIEAIRLKDKQTGRGRAVNLYFLDNEPALWSHTHRDVHPTPTTYDELWDKTLKYARAIRKADPDAVIAGPSEWGWTNFFNSAADSTAGRTLLRPDRRKHGDLPIVAWWLKQAAEHEKKTGERLIDVFDLHFYPQHKDLGIGSTGKVDPVTSALRIRSARGLWDPTYKDESWINDTVRLLPRMREWIDQYYPGRGISIGEYNFGADLHASGGLAQAEALGRFGQEGVQYAFVWYWPPKGSASAQGFKAFRNFDGKGGRFLDYSVPTRTSGAVSLFASRDATSSKLVLVALNTDPTTSAIGAIQLQGCGPVGVQRVYQTTFGQRGLEPVKAAKVERAVLPPYSITVFELTLAATELLK
ncbi:MAG: Endoglucanase precursor, partial [Myxococcaceae bacterium]|nr:Endoglucanase precursor [Myxococcaceae bacterium]